MDYGKLAYLKALDLEGRLGIKYEGFNVWHMDRFDIPSGRNFLCDIDGSGEIAVFVESDTYVDIYVDDALAASGKNLFFVYGGGNIYVESEAPIGKLRIMALGNVKSDIKLGLVRADILGDNIAYVINDNGTAKGYVYSISSKELTDLSVEGYLQGDVCALNDDLLFAYVARDGKVDLYEASGKKYTYDLGAKSVAVSYCEGSIYVAFVKNGTIYYFVLGSPGDACSPVKLAFNSFVDEVRLTKRGTGLCFFAGKKCYFKELGAMSKFDDRVYVKIGKEVV